MQNSHQRTEAEAASCASALRAGLVCQVCSGAIPETYAKEAEERITPEINMYPELDITTIKVSPYYKAEFSKIESGQPGKFNWVAFFFPIIWALSKRLWVAALVYFLIEVVGSGLAKAVPDPVAAIFICVLTFAFHVQIGWYANQTYYWHLRTGEQRIVKTDVMQIVLWQKSQEEKARKEAVLEGKLS